MADAESALTPIIGFTPSSLDFGSIPVASTRDLDGWLSNASGDLAYVADDGSGLAIVDVSDPRFPFVVTRVRTRDGAQGVALWSHYAFVADGSAGLPPDLFVWTRCPDAVAYRLEVMAPSGDIVYQAETADTLLALPPGAALASGAAATWRVTPLGPEGEALPASERVPFRVR